MNDAIVTQADRENDARIDAWKALDILPALKDGEDVKRCGSFRRLTAQPPPNFNSESLE